MDSLILPIVCTSVFCVLSALYDLWVWKGLDEGESLNHDLRWWARGGFLLIFGLMDMWLFPVCFFWFYLWFDPLLALLKGLKFFYLGKTAKWDAFMHERPITRFLVELFLFLLSCYLFTQYSA